MKRFVIVQEDPGNPDVILGQYESREEAMKAFMSLDSSISYAELYSIDDPEIDVVLVEGGVEVDKSRATEETAIGFEVVEGVVCYLITEIQYDEEEEVER